MKQTIKDKAKLTEMLATAQDNLEVLVEAFDCGNMNEEQFKWHATWRLSASLRERRSQAWRR